MYITPVSDLERLLARAAEEKVDFVIHLGDFSNDYVGSPEITDLYLNNPYGLPVYGIYGNHELESNNRMVCYTPPDKPHGYQTRREADRLLVYGYRQFPPDWSGYQLFSQPGRCLGTQL